MDMSDFAERHFGRWGWSRFIFATILALVAFLIVSQEIARPFVRAEAREGIRDGQVQHGVLQRWRGLEDPREFTKIDPSGRKPYGIAWIYGSEAAIRSAPPEWRLRGRADYELTEVLADYIPETDGQPVVVHEFRESGVRSGDERRAVLYAASAPEIDAIIMPLSPMFLFNDYVLFNPTNRRADLLRYHNLSAIDYKIAAALLRPADIVAEAAEAYSPYFRYRFDINQAEYRSQALPFLARKAAVNLSGSMAVIWLNLLFPGSMSAELPQSLRGSEFLRAVLFMTQLSASSVGAQLFKADLQTLAASGKPTVLYMQPLNPGLRDDPQALRRVEAFIAMVKQIAGEVDAPNVLIATDTAFATKPPYEHIELYHLKDGQGVVETLVDLLERVSGKTFSRSQPASIYAGTPSPVQAVPQ